MDLITNDVRLEHWVSVVQACNTSGISKRQWCRENNVNEKRFYYWQRRIRQLVYQESMGRDDIIESPPVFAELPVAMAEQTPVVPESSGPRLTLSKGNLSIEITALDRNDLLKVTKELLLDA